MRYVPLQEFGDMLYKYKDAKIFNRKEKEKKIKDGYKEVKRETLY